MTSERPPFKRVAPTDNLASRGLKIQRVGTNYAVVVQATLRNPDEWATQDSKVASADIRFVDMETGHVIGRDSFETNRRGPQATLKTLRKATKRHLVKNLPEFLSNDNFELRIQSMNVNVNRQKVLDVMAFTQQIYYVLLLTFVPTEK